jgi:hypothetical protein
MGSAQVVGMKHVDMRKLPAAAQEERRRQEMEVRQLSLALGETAAEGLAFRLAVETGEADRVERVVFLALRGEDRVECF